MDAPQSITDAKQKEYKMTEAALDDDLGVTLNDAQENLETESAPVEQVEPPAEAPEELTERAQKRFNKIVADKHAEKRRADEAERKLSERSIIAPVVEAKEAPKLEDFEYDQDAFNAALIDYKVAEQVSQAVAQVTSTQSDAVKARESQEAQQGFNDRIVALAKPDFDEVANNVPLLPNGVADALVRSENGAELIYHLGNHLDLADKIANMSPQAAMMELGRISATMAATPAVKLSAAPDPIEPLNSGGSISQEAGPKGAT